MGTTQKMSASTLMQITGVSGKQYKKVRWHDHELVIRHFLSIEEYVEVVHAILKDCLSENGDFALELIDPSIRQHIILAYAFVDLPEDINQRYYVLYASDLFDVVRGIANKEQIDSILLSVKLYTEYLNGGDSFGNT